MLTQYCRLSLCFSWTMYLWKLWVATEWAPAACQATWWEPPARGTSLEEKLMVKVTAGHAVWCRGDTFLLYCLPMYCHLNNDLLNLCFSHFGISDWRCLTGTITFLPQIIWAPVGEEQFFSMSSWAAVGGCCLKCKVWHFLCAEDFSLEKYLSNWLFTTANSRALRNWVWIASLFC